ncbi:GxxExxY protein [Neolewinella antarctica]|uniref:GxxExxY protein n=1 Tax=Neolewinella antarctica TaxID=442734 RepID=A0ABX0X948_9BACT|nr:GxxExxY protein [Neolewinella antarctica]
MKHITQTQKLSLQEVSQIVVHEIYQTYFTYGPGLFEKIYEATLAGRLRDRGLRVERQKMIVVSNQYVREEIAFYADLIVEDQIIIELKSVEKLHPIAFTQLRSYLKLTGIEVGLLVNFNCDILKKNIHRVVNNYDSHRHRINLQKTG